MTDSVSWPRSGGATSGGCGSDVRHGGPTNRMTPVPDLKTRRLSLGIGLKFQSAAPDKTEAPGTAVQRTMIEMIAGGLGIS